MKPKITFELVCTVNNLSTRPRIYKASQRMTKKADGRVYSNFGEIIKVWGNKEKTATKEWIKPDYFDHVVISDAHTHVERLAFPCWEFEPVMGNLPYLWQTDTIAGVKTLMIYGGDIRSVKPDHVYLRMLAKANGYQYTKKGNQNA